MELHWGGINCISEGEVCGGINTLRVGIWCWKNGIWKNCFGSPEMKGCLFVGALGEAVSDEVSRSWKALPHDTIPAHGSGHQQLYCFSNNSSHGTAMKTVILAGEDGVQRFRLQCQSPLVGKGSRRNLDRTGLMRVWPLSRACKHKVHIQLNWLLPYAFNPIPSLVVAIVT